MTSVSHSFRAARQMLLQQLLLRLAGPIAIVSVAIWCAFGLLVVVIGPGPKVSPTVTAVTAIDQNVPAISLTLPVSTAKSDR
jgi:hypothetical protein